MRLPWLRVLDVTAFRSGSAVAASAVERLERRLHGEVLRPGQRGYDDARAIWNGMVQRRPALIARCVDAADVQTAVRFGRDEQLLTAIRSGGHSMPGLSMCDDGLVIDLSHMKDIRIDAPARRAYVAAGCTLGDYDRVAQAYGLATPAGAIAHTGVAGLTLGGGMGWLHRPYGLTIDSLVAVDLVTADGERLRASEEENPDLFWGVRGGGGNFGVVTSFDFRLHPVGPMVLAGAVVHPLERAREVLRLYRDWIETVPDRMASIAAVFTCPPEPQFPEHLHGRHVCGVIVNWIGTQAEGERVLAPLRAFGPPEADTIALTPFVELQSSQDEKFAWGRRYYNKNAYLDALPDEVVDACVTHIQAVTSPLSAVAIQHMRGAVSRVGPQETAYLNRDALINLDITSIWTDAAEDEEHIGWVRGFHAAAFPYSTGGEYVNTTSMDGRRDVRAAYGLNYERLVAVKDRYDPTNFFRLNQNVEPTA
jgi:FAD/FMN-containing dehydrogenase